MSCDVFLQTSGVVLSRAALVKLAPHFEDCFKSHIDNVDRPPSFGILFGKCIHQILAIGCTWSQGVSSEYEEILYIHTSSLFEGSLIVQC